MQKIISGFIASALLLLALDASARFVSVDPVQANPDNGQNFNRYYYVDNNPYKFTDPDGRAKACAIGGCVITADTYRPDKSNGQTTLASPDLRAAGNAAVSQFTVQSGSKESLGFFVPDANGKPVAQPARHDQHQQRYWRNSIGHHPAERHGRHTRSY